MNICIYGASSNDIDNKYMEAVEKLGREMAVRNHSLVFGGGAQGLMGAAVKGLSEAEGFSLGVAPIFFDKPGILYDKCSEFIFTKTMRERKQIMEDRSDAFVMVPGGIGTFEEFFEILTLRQLGQHNKPIAIYNVCGYYDDLIVMMKRTANEGFMKPQSMSLYGIFDQPEALLNYIETEGDNYDNSYCRQA